MSVSVSEIDGFFSLVDLFDGWFLRTACVYVQVCHALLRVACQKAAPHNVAGYGKTSHSPNPPWLAPLLQPLAAAQYRASHKAQTPVGFKLGEV